MTRPGRMNTTEVVYRLYETVDELTTVIENARSVPMSSSCMVPRDHVLDLRVPDTPPAVTAWAESDVPRRSVGDEVSAAATARTTVPCRPGVEADGVAVVGTVHPARVR